MLVIDAVMALGLIPGAWRRCDRAEVGTMTLGAMVGVPFGTAALARLDALTLRWGIALSVASLFVLLVAGWRTRGRPATWLTVCVGGIAGFCSGAAQIGGPPVVAYRLGGAKAGETVRADVILCFAVSTAPTLISSGTAHLVTPSVPALSLLVGPAYGLGLLVGARLFGRAAEATFRRICLALIAAAAIIGLPALDGLLR